MKKANKKVYLEVIRSLALLCIVFNHTGGRGNNVYLFTNGKITFLLSLVSDILCRMGVPLFFMISGALLLQKKESLQRIYRIRVVRILKVIVLFTTIRYLYECFWIKNMEFSVLKLLQAIFTGNLFLPYWFLYSYLSILLLLPFFKNMVQNTTKDEMYVFMGLFGFFSVVLPVISIGSGWDFGKIPMLGLNFCYFILGYGMEYVIEKDFYSAKNTAGVIAAIFLSVGVESGLTIFEKMNRHEVTGRYVSLLTPVIAFCVFFVVKAFFERKAEKRESGLLAKMILHVGSCCFGIYLIEDYLRNGLAFIYDTCCPYVTTMPACAIWIFTVILVGIVVVSCLKKIPGFRKIL